MLINRRNALMASRRSPLPPGARWVEYLESTGTQYIDTGIVPANIAPSLSVEWALTSIPASAENLYFIGSDGPGDSRFSLGYLKNSSALEFRIGNYTRGPQLAKNTPVALVIDGASGRYFVNGSLYGTSSYNSSNTTFSSDSILIFTSHASDGSVRATTYHSRIYSCKIWDGNVLVRDFRPIAIGATGYMLDMVSGKYLPYGNAGTDNFGIGPDVVPVEWLESHGTEYVPLNDIHPSYYTNRYTVLDYQLTKIEASLIQQIGASSLNAILCTGGGYVESVNTGIPADLDPHRIVFDGVSSPYHVSYDGTSIKTFNRSTNSDRVFTLFGTDQSGTFVPSCHMKLTRMTIRSAQNGTTEHDYLPVRVGTDATSWEGAMMDTLTRRIYRNQGTSAFAYGADLPLETLAN